MSSTQTARAAQHSEPTESPISGETALIYGEVVTVKPIPTRQVTQIVIEIPEEHHIAATQLLFKRNAFIMPCAQKTPLAGVAFGVTTLGRVMNPPGEPEPTRQPSAGGLVRPNVNVTQWLALKGSDPNFQRFMGASSESEAAQAVRQRCGVGSRSEIATNEAALKIFMNEIYVPFTSRFPNIRSLNPHQKG